jgi:serine phosphatase RsbU (regulator of sigma subunit)
VNDRARRIRLALLLIAAITLALAVMHLGVLSTLSRVFLAAGSALFLLWLLWRAYQRFFWKVGRRLALSYVLIGILPIPMVLVIFAVVGYLLSGFFLGHLFRDATRSLQRELDLHATARAAAFGGHGQGPASEGNIAFGYYRGGKRVAGDPRTPSTWPAWADAAAATVPLPALRFVTGPKGQPTLAGAATYQGAGAVALFVGPLEGELSRRSALWVELFRSDDPELLQISLQVRGRRVPVQYLHRDQQAVEAAKFFKHQGLGRRFWDRPAIWWGEISGPLLDLRTGKEEAAYLAANLNGTPRTALESFFSAAAEIDFFAWGALLVVAFLLFDVYLAATLMAVFLIFGLSRAVNRMSKATDAVRRGDFSVRIPVRRRDQLGDLQRSFNEMAGHLETLVATATQKELLERELALARDLQQSLIPTDLPAGEGVELASFFEPSAAIGGDYFDVLRLSRDELAVIIADVSGHGLSTGLRMAMLKAAFLILIEETRQPQELLRRLDAVVRARDEKKFFVTATLGIVNLTTAELSLTNAGHPPTYLIRRGAVEEIALEGSPLGRLGHDYGQRQVPLERGDILVWLSDGLIEAPNERDEPFGYDGIRRILAGPESSDATAVRNRLLAAVTAHTQGKPPRDDCTLVVMRYLGPPSELEGEAEVERAATAAGAVGLAPAAADSEVAT